MVHEISEMCDSLGLMNSEPPIDPKVCINPASAVVADSTEGTPRPKYRPTKTGKRNESSLIAFDKVIRDARNQNPPISYTKICKLLLEKHNVKVARNTVFNYVKVRSKELVSALYRTLSKFFFKRAIADRCWDRHGSHSSGSMGREETGG